MDYSKKQTQLDVKKWVDSEIKGYDTCGSYNYCSSCNKEAAYPCAYAYDKFTTIAKLAKEAAGTSTTAKKTTTRKSTSTTAKTSTGTSTTAKKTTTGTTTTKKTTTRKTTSTKATVTA